MNILFEKIQHYSGLSIETQGRILSSFLIVFALIFVRYMILRVINSQTEDISRKYYLRRSVGYVITALAVLFIGRVWFKGLQALSTILGIASAGLIIALQDSVLNIAGWLFIIIRTPFKVGDRIEIGQIKGDVIDIRLFQFSMIEIGNWVDAEQSTGRIVHVPNGKVFREALFNYTQGFNFVWHEIPVLITFESHCEDARKIIERVAFENVALYSEAAQKQIRKATDKYLIFFQNTEPAIYLTVRDSGVLLTLRFLVHPRERRGAEQKIWEAILSEFSKRQDIDFAYPTVRYYQNQKEGKPGTQNV